MHTLLHSKAPRYTVEQALEEILGPTEEAHPEVSSPYSSSVEDGGDTEWEVSMQSGSPYSWTAFPGMDIQKWPNLLVSLEMQKPQVSDSWTNKVCHRPHHRASCWDWLIIQMTNLQSLARCQQRWRRSSACGLWLGFTAHARSGRVIFSATVSRTRFEQLAS